MSGTDGIQIYPDGRMDALNTAKYSGFSSKTLAKCALSGDGARVYQARPNLVLS